MCQWQVERFEMGRSHQGQFMALSIKREALHPTGSINWEPMLLPFVFTVCEFSHWWKMTRKLKNLLPWKHMPSEILYPPDQSSLPTAMLFLLRNTFLQFDRCPLQARVWTFGLQLVVLFWEIAEPLGNVGVFLGEMGWLWRGHWRICWLLDLGQAPCSLVQLCKLPPKTLPLPWMEQPHHHASPTNTKMTPKPWAKAMLSSLHCLVKKPVSKQHRQWDETKQAQGLKADPWGFSRCTRPKVL